MEKEFEIFYPGKYSAEDEKFLEKVRVRREAISRRGEIDIGALVSGRLGPDTPGVSPRRYEAVGYERKMHALNFDRGNPLYFDAAYARKAGYRDVAGFPTAHALDAVFLEAMPEELSDFLVVSGLTHSFEFYLPVYENDVIFFVTDEIGFDDITPAEGGEYRTFFLRGRGRGFNQNGELVLSGHSRVRESLRRYLDREKAERIVSGWECPAWWERPKHVYTDADWDFIKDVWAHEAHRGAAPLYWEDVKIGDEPAPTLDGPLTHTDMIKHHALGQYVGSPPLKEMLSHPMFKSMLSRDQSDGMYYMRSSPFAHVDDGRFPEARPAFYNFLCRDFAVRMLTDWMGDGGWLKDITWSIMPYLPGYEGKILGYPDNPVYVERLPDMKGRGAKIHGMAGDCSFNKARVTGKYVRDGEHLVDLVWWCETIDGQVFEEGLATVRLPSKNPSTAMR